MSEDLQELFWLLLLSGVAIVLMISALCIYNWIKERKRIRENEEAAIYHFNKYSWVNETIRPYVENGILTPNEARIATNRMMGLPQPGEEPEVTQPEQSHISEPDGHRKCEKCNHALVLHNNWCEEKGCTCLKM